MDKLMQELVAWLLESGLEEAQAQGVAEKFKARYEQKMRSLSLEDMDDLAKDILELRARDSRPANLPT